MLSNRALENNVWFLKAFARALKRQEFKQPDSIDFATAENWLIRPDLLDAIKSSCITGLEANHLSYAGGLGGPPELLSAVANFYNHLFTPKFAVKAEHIVVGAGCSGIIDSLINDICDRGEGLLVEAPMWGSFELSAVMRNDVRIVPVYVPSEKPPSSQDIIAAYRAAAQKSKCKVRGVLFCNPHNPSGHIHTTETIELMLRYCEESDLQFISDEIYALSTFGKLASDLENCDKVSRSPTSQFKSVLQIDLELLGVSPSRVHQIYSVSKDFGSSGLRLGCLVTQGNKELRMSQAILNNAKISNLVSVIFTPLLNDLQRMRKLVDMNQYRLREAAQTAVEFCEFHQLPYYSPVAGLFIWVRLSPTCTTWDEEERIVQRCSAHGVLIGSGADYADQDPGWFRLVYSVTKADLQLGLRRIEEALEYPTEFQLAKFNPGVVTMVPLSSWMPWLKASKSWIVNKFNVHH